MPWKTIVIRTSNERPDQLGQDVNLLFTLTPGGDLADLSAYPVAFEVQSFAANRDTAFEFSFNSEIYFSVCELSWNNIVVPGPTHHIPVGHFAQYGVPKNLGTSAEAKWTPCKHLSTEKAPDDVQYICAKNKFGKDVAFALCVIRSFALQDDGPHPIISFKPLSNKSSIRVRASLELQVYQVPLGYQRNEKLKRKVEKGTPLFLQCGQAYPLRVESMDMYSTWLLHSERTGNGQVVLSKDPPVEIQEVKTELSELATEIKLERESAARLAAEFKREREEANQRERSLQSSFRDLEQQMNSITDDWVAISASLSGVWKKMEDSLSAKADRHALAQLETHVRSVQGEVQAVVERIARIRQDIEQNSRNGDTAARKGLDRLVEQTRKNFDRVDHRIEKTKQELEKHIDEVGDTVKTLETLINSVIAEWAKTSDARIDGIRRDLEEAIEAQRKYVGEEFERRMHSSFQTLVTNLQPSLDIAAVRKEVMQQIRSTNQKVIEELKQDLDKTIQSNSELTRNELHRQIRLDSKTALDEIASMKINLQHSGIAASGKPNVELDVPAEVAAEIAQLKEEMETSLEAWSTAIRREFEESVDSINNSIHMVVRRMRQELQEEMDRVRPSLEQGTSSTTGRTPNKAKSDPVGGLDTLRRELETRMRRAKQTTEDSQEELEKRMDARIKKVQKESEEKFKQVEEKIKQATKKMDSWWQKLLPKNKGQ